MTKFQEFSLSAKDLLEVFAAVGKELDKWLPSWLEAGLDTWVQVEVTPDRVLDVKIDNDEGRLAISVYPVLNPQVKGLLRTDTAVWVQLVDLHLNQPRPPFSFSTYFAEADGTPVVHVETLCLDEDAKGPICRVYLNDQVLYENPRTLVHLLAGEWSVARYVDWGLRQLLDDPKAGLNDYARGAVEKILDVLQANTP